MKTIAQQLQDLANTRAAKLKRMEIIAQKAIDDGRSMDASEQEEFDTIESEIKSLDDDIGRLGRLETLSKAAKPVQQPREGDSPQKSAGQQRDPVAPAIIRKDPEDKFKGQSYVRLLIAKTLGQLRGENPLWIAQKRWAKSNPMLFEVLKAAVAGGGSDSGEWGAELVTADNRYTGDFIEYLYSKTVFDQLPFTEVPANVTIKGQDGQATGYWVGQSKAIPATTVDFMSVSLTPLKVAALAVCSIELLEDSSPSAELLVRDALVKASSQRIDTTLFSTAAASSGVSPAGLLNGVTPVSALGLDGDAVREGIGALYAPFITAKNASDLYFVMSPGRAKATSLITNAFSQKEFGTLTAQGGMLEGDPVKTGDNVDSSHVILLKPSDVYKIGDGGVEVYMSREATIEQDTVPQGATDTPVAASANLTNMFQEHSVAFKVVRRINFAKRRSHAVQYANDVSWGDAQS